MGVEMDEQTKKRMLEWFLRFINKDLNQLDLGEKMKLIGDAITIISGRGAELFSVEAPAHLLLHRFDEDDESMVMPDPWGDKKALESAVADWLKEDKLSICQERLKTFFDSLINNFRMKIAQIAKNENLRIESKSTILLGHETLDKINILLGMTIDQEALEIDELAEDDQMSVEDTEFVIVEGETVMDPARSADFDADLFEFEDDKIEPYFNAVKSTPIDLSYKGSIEGETLQLYFCIVLEGAYFGSFKKCIECGTLFVHTSKRKRLFCTPQCAMRKANRDKRKSIKEHDPVEYKKELVEGRKRAKKSYRKRTKK